MLGVLFWSRVRHNVETLGLGGAFAKASYRVIGLPPLLRVRCNLVPFPVRLRFGTTDLPLFDAVFGARP